MGIEDILEAIVHTLPAPVADSTLPLRALIFDSYYDAYRGVVVFFRVVDGEIRKGDKIRFMNSGVEYEVLEVGVMTPVQVKVDVLRYDHLLVALSLPYCYRANLTSIQPDGEDLSRCFVDNVAVFVIHTQLQPAMTYGYYSSL